MIDNINEPDGGKYYSNKYFQTIQKLLEEEENKQKNTIQDEEKSSEEKRDESRDKARDENPFFLIILLYIVEFIRRRSR